MNNSFYTRSVTPLIVVMGVCGSGKSSVGDALAKSIGAVFLDGDDYHPAQNVAKMAQGTPLTDEDRWPWLDALGRALVKASGNARYAVAACSALRRAYRDRLIAAAGQEILFVYLEGSRELITKRMSARTNHFMPTGLIDSQFATLEPPSADENVMAIDIGPSVDVLVERLSERIRASG